MKLTGMMPKRCHVDRGYKGHGVDPNSCRVIIAGSRKGITKAIKKEMKRRSAIEPEVGRQKAGGKLGRNWLKGVLGDAQKAVLCAVGHNRRKILDHLKRLFSLIWTWLTATLNPLPRIPGALGPVARSQTPLFQDGPSGITLWNGYSKFGIWFRKAI